MCLSTRRFQTMVMLFLLSLALGLPAAQQVNARGPADEHAAMGNPSNASHDPNHSENYLIVKPEFVLSYNAKTGTPNWVSWHLSKDWLGKEKRANSFRADDDLPESWFHVDKTTYAGSGFDRGHMCPSGDRTKDRETNNATYVMTNMVPQAPRNNQHTWKSLEDYCRSLVDDGDELYIIAGPNGVSGHGKNGIKRKLAHGQVTVPHVTWKVIMALKDHDGNDVERVNAHTRLIAVIMPNEQSIDADWTEYRVSVDDVEELTGFDFFSNVSDPIETEIEAVVDDEEVD